MASKGTIGILTGGGDVPGLNPAIRAITIRALREGYKVIGLRRGWAGLVDMIRDASAHNAENFLALTPDLVNRAARTGGTFLHTSRTRPSHLPKGLVPEHMRERYTADINDVTPEILKNIEFLGLDYLIPIGGDDTLSYAQRLHKEGVRVVAIPKTMDNDVPGTDYCIGFSTCVTRTIELTHQLRTTAGSHERFLVIEVFGRYAGFTALLPTMAGAADRCVIPEHPFDIELLCRRIRRVHTERRPFSIVVVSEGAVPIADTLVLPDYELDENGWPRLGGIGRVVATEISLVTRAEARVTTLGHVQRGGSPVAFDRVLATRLGAAAIDAAVAGRWGHLVGVRGIRIELTPLAEVGATPNRVPPDRFQIPEVMCS
jgi:6-phosphofructokinase 1